MFVLTACCARLDFGAKDLAEPLLATIRINGETIMEREAGHWEPQDLKKKIEKKLGDEYVIRDVEMTGVSGSTIVIDELIDFMGLQITKGELKVLILDIATNKNLTDLTPSVFETLASKCTKLERLELRGTARIKAEGPRRVLHEFFCKVIGVCDKAGTLQDLRLSQSASEKDEADELLQCLACSE